MKWSRVLCPTYVTIPVTDVFDSQSARQLSAGYHEVCPAFTYSALKSIVREYPEAIQSRMNYWSR